MTSATIGSVGPRLRAGQRAAALSVAGAAAAALGGFLLFHGPVLAAAAFCVAPLVIWLFARPALAAVLLGASIPVMYSVNRAGLHAAPSDLLIVFTASGLFFEAVVSGALPSLRALKPLKPALVQYSLLLVVLLVIHLSLKDLVQTGQRFELFFLPLVIGSFAALTGRQMAVLKAYVIGATALAALWPVAHGLGQKNPVGQMIANALLLLLGVRALRPYSVCALVLVPGLLLTGSRGSLVAAVVGAAVLLALQESRARALFTRVSVVLLLALVTYAVLPASLQQRLTTFSAGRSSRAAYALEIRQQYAHDAVRIIKSHPLVGIGVGNYFAGTYGAGTLTTDPHDVLLLQAAEGGYAFAASFILLIVGVALVLRRIRGAPLAPVAAGIFMATFAHGLVDVYWVRATPVLGWLLVGMACGEFARHRESRSPEAR